MRQAGVNLVSRRRSSPGRCWSRSRGQYEFGWLDRIMDLLHAGGIGVDLANATRLPAAVVLPRYPRVAAGRRGRRAAAVTAAGRRSARPRRPTARPPPR